MKKILFTLCLLLASKAYAEPMTPYQMASFVFQGVSFAISSFIPKEIVVKGVGYGNTNEEAIQNALVDSVQRGIGVFVVTDQTVNGDKVIKNLAATYSSGIVNSYNVESCEFNKCVVIARVSPWNFRRKLEGDSAVMRVNGNDLHAQYHTTKTAMIQRNKMTEYYFKSIRPLGLEVKIKELRIIPSYSNKATITLDYEVLFNRQFKRDIISFLEKLEKDTNGKSKGDEAVYIQWGPTGLAENRVYISADDANTRSMMLKYMHEHIEVYFQELNHCEKMDVKTSIFTIGWHEYKKKTTFQIDPKLLQNINKITAKIGCV